MTPAADPWKDVTAARIPLAGAPALGPVRDRADVRVTRDGERLWVCWPAGRADVVRCLLPVPGVVFLVPRGGAWFPFGRRLPTADVPPPGDGVPVASILAPARFEPVVPGEVPPPVTLRVVRGGEPKPASAMVCAGADLATWADTAPTAELAAVTAARAGGRVILRFDFRWDRRPAGPADDRRDAGPTGPNHALPSVPGATRFWGDVVLVPVGFRPEPDLRPAAIRAAVGAAADEIVLLDEAGADAIPRAAFAPVTRAVLRLAGAVP